MSTYGKIKNFYDEKIAKDFLNIEGIKSVAFNFYEKLDDLEDNNSYPAEKPRSEIILFWKDERKTMVEAFHYHWNKEETLKALTEEGSDIKSIDYKITRRDFTIDEFIDRLAKEKDNKQRKNELETQLAYTLADRQGLAIKTKKELEEEKKSNESYENHLNSIIKDQAKDIDKRDKKIEELRHRSLLKRILNKEDKGLQR